MSGIRGLEMIAIGKERFFEVFYEDGAYRDGRGKPVEGLLDMICFACGAAYYTLEDQTIEFCPACGQFERTRFENLREIGQWANGQNWKFLAHNAKSVFAVTRGDGWYLAFARERVELESKGIYAEIHALGQA